MCVGGLVGIEGGKQQALLLRGEDEIVKGVLSRRHFWLSCARDGDWETEQWVGSRKDFQLGVERMGRIHSRDLIAPSGRSRTGGIVEFIKTAGPMAIRLAENPGYRAQDVRMSKSKTDVGVDQMLVAGC